VLSSLNYTQKITPLLIYKLLALNVSPCRMSPVS
jgi:hypothetical protein